MVAPVDITAAYYRTLLLGMKGSRDYVYRIVVNSAAGSCTSAGCHGAHRRGAGECAATDADDPDARRRTRPASSSPAAAPRWAAADAIPVYILDGDGEPVWWATAPGAAAAARR